MGSGHPGRTGVAIRRTGDHHLKLAPAATHPDGPGRNFFPGDTVFRAAFLALDPDHIVTKGIPSHCHNAPAADPE
jgi:hypothetical protein